MAYNAGILLLHEQLTRFLPLGTRKNLIYFTPSLNLSAHVKINIYAIFFFKQNVSNRFLNLLGGLFVSQDSIKLASNNDNGHLIVTLIQISILN